MTPWLDDGDVTLFHGSALDVLASLPADSVQTCITSPPYWGLRSYLDDGHDDKAHELGLEPTPDAYVAAMVSVFREVRRVLRPDGTLFLNLGDSFMPGKQQAGIPWKVAEALRVPYYTGRIRNEGDRIWLTAMVEAEGCMFIHKRGVGQYASSYTRQDGTETHYHRKNASYGSGLEVSSTDRVIVERCQEIAGIGSICEQSPEQNQRRKQTIYRWSLRSNECRDVVRELYPYMIAKRHEARLLIGCPSSGSDAEAAHEGLKAIHQGGSSRIDFAEPASMFEPGWILRSDIIWAKKNCMPESVTDRPTKAHEYVFLLSKGPRYYYDQEAIREDLAEITLRTHGSRRTESDWGNLAARGTGDKKLRSFGMNEGDLTGGRNARSVWTIATQPTPEAHFATYPEELVRRCILAGTSEAGECSVCGAPWQRQVETIGQTARERVAERGAAAYYEANTNGLNHAGAHAAGRPRLTTGWTPSCGCGAPPRPQQVLDPFVGSGTTALVARRHGRHAIGIDLNSSYLEIAARRTAQLSLLAEGGAA